MILDVFNVFYFPWSSPKIQSMANLFGSKFSSLLPFPDNVHMSILHTDSHSGDYYNVSVENMT